MTIDEVRRALALPELDDSFCRDWEASSGTLPAGSTPYFLSDTYIADHAPLVSLPEEETNELVGTARRARGNPALCLLLWHEHRLFSGLSTPGMARSSRRPVHRWSRTDRSVPFLDQEIDPSGFPDLSPAAGRDAAPLNLLIALSALPHTQALYRQRRIPEEILRDTLADFAVWHRYYRERLGFGGINPGTLSWLRFHLRGQLFRLGRLQFMQGSFPREFTVYRRVRAAGGERAELHVLTAAGLSVDAEGLLLAGDEGEEGMWTTRRRATPTAVSGNPVAPSGRIERDEVRLAFDEYQPVLQEGSGVLEVHIPEGGPIDPAACADSVARAVGFFPTYFPERPFRAFTCESWFLGRELLDLLPPDSNMARFARELYLYPCLAGEDEALARIFGPTYADHLGREPARWPRRTRLQRRVASHVAAGGRLREGGGFILTEDLPWGGAAYQG